VVRLITISAAFFAEISRIFQIVRFRSVCGPALSSSSHSSPPFVGNPPREGDEWKGEGRATVENTT
jgi:hypothetical protein